MYQENILTKLKIFLIDPEFLNYLAANSFIFSSHLGIIFKNKMAVNAFHFMFNPD